MRKITLLIVIVAGLAVLLMAACTPPPQAGEERETGVTETGAGETPSEAQTATGAPGEEVAEAEEGEAGEEAAEEETAEGAEEGEEAEEEKMPQTPNPATPFSRYTSWPPDSISAEDIEFLHHVVVVLETTKGIIKIRVHPEAAPIHSANFVKLVMDGFYDGLKFHRVIQGFMSQGGDPEGTGQGGPGYTLPAEIGLPHVAGSIAAARLRDEDNPERRSSGSQFYLCHTDESCARLNGMYTVFGQIVEGLDVNLSLSVNYTGQGAIPGAPTDSIIRAWVESF